MEENIGSNSLTFFDFESKLRYSLEILAESFSVEEIDLAF